MFKNIIIGQYINTGSVIHRLDARTKLIITITAAAAVFLVNSSISAVIVTAACLIWMILSRLKPSVFIKSIKPVLFLTLFTFIFNLFFTGNTIIFKIGFIHPTYEGLIEGAVTAWRLILLVMTASVLTLTTKPLELTDAIESLLSVLRFIKVPVHDISVMMGITIRFIPTFAYEIQKISDAQRSRCSELDCKKFSKKAKAVIPLIIPLLISALRHSDTLASALDARCYGLTPTRSKLHPSYISKRDITAFILSGIVLTAVIGIKIFC